MENSVSKQNLCSDLKEPKLSLCQNFLFNWILPIIYFSRKNEIKVEHLIDHHNLYSSQFLSNQYLQLKNKSGARLKDPIISVLFKINSKLILIAIIFQTLSLIFNCSIPLILW